MEQPPDTVLRERVVAALLVITGIAALVLSLKDVDLFQLRVVDYLLALLFAGAIVLADQYPIHLMRGTKLIFINLPIFLAAVLLPAPLAVLATGAGLLIANLRARVERGLLPRDIASTVSQWMFTAFLGYQIVHLTLPGILTSPSRLVLLFVGAFLFLFLDLVLFSLSQSFVYREPFTFTLKSIVVQGAYIEVIQYLIAILGAVAADRELWSLTLLTVPVFITYTAFKNIKETRYETVQILQHLADAVDLRDIYTGGHSQRVAELVRETLIELNIGGTEASLIELAARLHDIGKIGIPDGILMKPAKLSAEEMAVMQTHSQKGAELLSRYKDFTRGAAIILHHHESWDGTGYPAGLRGHQIPFGSRVIAVADSFDAMTSDRPYRQGRSASQAIQILLDGRDQQWEGSIVNAFVEMITRKIDETSGEYLLRPQGPSSLAQAAPTPS
jgi:HD-GYP domain-containing protein (c-di-GMP phosphodiesterase class II)